MEHLQSWCDSWLPSSVFSAGKGRSSVEAWYSTSIDIEEAISGIVDDDVHVFVADVVKSFDTVDRNILDCVLSSLGLPGWFRHTYFEYHSKVRIRFKLAAGLGEPWTRDGGIPQGCPLSMMFIVALYLPWCLGLAEMAGVFPQLYADNLKCVSYGEAELLAAAQFTSRYIRLVGQEAAPSKCVLLSTSSGTRNRMKTWDISGAGDCWTVRLDVRDLGGHLDSTYRGRTGTLADRIPPVRASCKAAGSLSLGFRGTLGLLRSKCIPAALHGVESSHISDANLNSLRTAFVGAAMSALMPLAHPGAVLSLLDGPDGCDPAYFVVWTRFRLLRRYLAYRPSETERIYRMLAAISTGVKGHGPIHLLLTSAAKIGFIWDADACNWTRPGLAPLHLISSPWQVFQTSILQTWRNSVFCRSLQKGRVSRSSGLFSFV